MAFSPKASQTTQIIGDSVATIVDAPASGTVRMCNLININNLSGSTLETFSFQINDNGTVIVIEQISLSGDQTYRFESPSLLLDSTQTLEVLPGTTPSVGLDVMTSFGDFT